MNLKNSISNFKERFKQNKLDRIDKILNVEENYIRSNKIKLPQSLDDFRENLKTYFVCFGNDLYVKNLNKRNHININEIEKISDLYSYTKRKNTIPMLTPKYEFIVGYDDQIDLIKKKDLSWYHINKEFMMLYFSVIFGNWGYDFYEYEKSKL